MLKVRVQRHEELSDAEREEYGRDECNYLRVTHNGETVRLHSDGMEPEDAYFHRDLSWVARAIEQAYELGKADSAKPLGLATRTETADGGRYG